VAGQDEVVLEAELVAKGEQARHFRPSPAMAQRQPVGWLA
jgi:hypothetical protein